MTTKKKVLRGNLRNLNSLGWKLHDNLKANRPEMFQDLKSQGQLNQYLLEQQTSIDQQLTELEDSGLQPHEAREMLRDQIYPPTEEDVPNLEESLRPYSD